MKGVRGIELIYLLYNAETFVALEDLRPFLEIAQDLRIKGIQNQFFGEKETFEEQKLARLYTNFHKDPIAQE